MPIGFAVGLTTAGPKLMTSSFEFFAFDVPARGSTLPVTIGAAAQARH